MMNESGLSEFPPFGGTKGGPIDEHTHPGIFGSPPFGGTKGVSFTGCNGSLMQFEILKFEKFCHFFESSVAAPESFRDISLKERNPVDAGREAGKAKY